MRSRKALLPEKRPFGVASSFVCAWGARRTRSTRAAVLASPRPQPGRPRKLCRLCLWTHWSLRPVLDLQPFEAGEVFVVCSHHDKPVDVGNRGNLTIDERRRAPNGFKSGSFLTVPRRSGLVVRTPRGRVATPAAWRHLGLRAPGPVDVLPLDLDAG